MASKFLAAQGNIEVPKRETPPTPPSNTLLINIADIEQICEKLEAEYPLAVPNDAQVKGAGLAGDGSHMVLYAIKQSAPSGTATIHKSGKLVVAGAMASFTL